MKTPREIGHETRLWVGRLRRESAYSGKPVPDLGEEAAKLGMLVALNAAGRRLHEIDDCNYKALAMIDELIAEVERG